MIAGIYETYVWCEFLSELMNLSTHLDKLTHNAYWLSFRFSHRQVEHHQMRIGLYQKGPELVCDTLNLLFDIYFFGCTSRWLLNFPTWDHQQCVVKPLSPTTWMSNISGCEWGVHLNISCTYSLLESNLFGLWIMIICSHLSSRQWHVSG